MSRHCLSGRCETDDQSESEKKVLHGGPPLKRIYRIESDRSDMARTVVHHVMSELAHSEIPGCMASGVITIYFAAPAIFVTWLCSLPFEQDWLADCQHRAESMGVATHEHRTAAPSLPFLVAGFNTSA